MRGTKNFAKLQEGVSVADITGLDGVNLSRNFL